jgi:Uma2 family endonuclease
MELVEQPDGSTELFYIPLTEDEFLHPAEDYRLPNSTFHNDVASDAFDMLSRRYANRTDTGIYRDLIIEWEDPELRDNCPDVFVAFGVRDPATNRTRFVVANENTHPSLVIEVVSPYYRSADREKKVPLYEQAQVPEYIIIDRRKQRGQTIDEVLGYRLVKGRFQPIAPDEDGRIEARTVGLWFSLHQGRLVLEDVASGERLLTSHELEQRVQVEQAARQAAEARTQHEQAARQAAEARAAAAEAELAALRAQLATGSGGKGRKKK